MVITTEIATTTAYTTTTIDCCRRRCGRSAHVLLSADNEKLFKAYDKIRYKYVVTDTNSTEHTHTHTLAHMCVRVMCKKFWGFAFILIIILQALSVLFV